MWNNHPQHAEINKLTNGVISLTQDSYKVDGIKTYLEVGFSCEHDLNLFAAILDDGSSVGFIGYGPNEAFTSKATSVEQAFLWKNFTNLAVENEALGLICRDEDCDNEGSDSCPEHSNSDIRKAWIDIEALSRPFARLSN